MIIFVKFGETIKIRNDHWKRLRARFNPENAVLNEDDERYEIRRTCPFCSAYYECKGCPLEEFDGKYGCFPFFEKVFKGDTEFDHDDITKIYWDEDFDKEARRELHKLQKMMDKIETSQ